MDKGTSTNAPSKLRLPEKKKKRKRKCKGELEAISVEAVPV